MSEISIIVSGSNEEGGEFIKPELMNGSFVARCSRITLLGTQSFVWEGKESKNQKVFIEFEFPKNLHSFFADADPEPIVKGKEFNLSLGKKAKLREFLESWRGVDFTDSELTGFELANLIGQPVQLSVKKYTKRNSELSDKIVSASMLMDGITCPDPITPTSIFTFNPWNQEKFDSLPQFIQDKIKLSPEYDEATSTQPEKKETPAQVSKQRKTPF